MWPFGTMELVLVFAPSDGSLLQAAGEKRAKLMIMNLMVDNEKDDTSILIIWPESKKY